MIQFFIKMSAVIAAAYFAVTLPQVGGLTGWSRSSRTMHGPGGLNYLTMLPDFTNNWDLAVAVFIMPIAVQWWAVWYPGAEPGGGSYIAQRMLASKSEKDALGGTALLQRRALRPAALAVDPGRAGLADRLSAALAISRRRFPHLDPSLLGHDIAYPAMLKFLPVGWMGLMVGGLIAANSSTILTHLNWGASYLVHDFYRRFVNTGATEKHYVMAGRVRHGAALRRFVRDWSSCSIRRRTASISSSRSAPARACSTWCAGSGGASPPGARSWRWSARFGISVGLPDYDQAGHGARQRVSSC